MACVAGQSHQGQGHRSDLSLKWHPGDPGGTTGHLINLDGGLSQEAKMFKLKPRESLVLKVQWATLALVTSPELWIQPPQALGCVSPSGLLLHVSP